jgi:hypothetical protein
MIVNIHMLGVLRLCYLLKLPARYYQLRNILFKPTCVYIVYKRY